MPKNDLNPRPLTALAQGSHILHCKQQGRRAGKAAQLPHSDGHLQVSCSDSHRYRIPIPSCDGCGTAELPLKAVVQEFPSPRRPGMRSSTARNRQIGFSHWPPKTHKLPLSSLQSQSIAPSSPPASRNNISVTRSAEIPPRRSQNTTCPHTRQAKAPGWRATRISIRSKKRGTFSPSHASFSPMTPPPLKLVLVRTSRKASALAQLWFGLRSAILKGNRPDVARWYPQPAWLPSLAGRNWSCFLFGDAVACLLTCEFRVQLPQYSTTRARLS